MNPTLVEEGKACVWGSEPIVRVERASQLHKLGESPSLGTCDMKGCPQPCNLDLGDRFCHMHLSRVYADKPGRMAAGGGASRSMPSSDLSRKNNVPKQRTVAPVPAEDGDEEVSRQKDGAKLVKTKVAVQFDDRRFHHSDANRDYVRSICTGSRPDGKETSRVPVLGRGLEGQGDLELDLATVDLDEGRKAQRMLEQRAGRAGRAALGPEPEPEGGRAAPGALELLSGLEAAGGDGGRALAALRAAGGLAAGALGDEAGRRLYEAVGRLTLDRASPEVKQLALRIRRRWRAQSDAAVDTSAGATA